MNVMIVDIRHSADSSLCRKGMKSLGLNGYDNSDGETYSVMEFRGNKEPKCGTFT